MRVIGHIIKGIFRAFFRILLAALLFGVIAAIIGAVIQYQTGQHWPPNQTASIVIIVVAVLAAYAAGITILLLETVRGLVDALHLAEKETFTAGNIIESGVKAVEHHHEAEHVTQAAE